jgi:hypothetical protein
MCVKGQLNQVKIKALKLIMNGEDEVFFGGKEKQLNRYLSLSFHKLSSTRFFSKPLSIGTFH